MRLELAAFCAVVFGSLYTVFRKFQCVATLEEGQQFNQPLLQAMIIFIGMTSIHLFKPFIPKEAEDKTKIAENRLIYFLPSLLDVIGTIFDTAGLFYTSVSVSQMLKGSALFFTYTITVCLNRKQLKLKQHFWMAIIVMALFMISYSNLHAADLKYESNPFFGNCLIIASQFIFAFMFVVEEKILKKYNTQVATAVLWEGIWGVIISGCLVFAFSNMDTSIVKCNFTESCSLIYNNRNLQLSILLTALSIAPFNYFGLMITKSSSALQRCMICTSRMVIVWLVSLIFSWEQFSILQFIGYCLLTYGIYRFNKESESQKSATPLDSQQNTFLKQSSAPPIMNAEN